MLNQESLNEAMDTLMTNVIEQVNEFAGKTTLRWLRTWTVCAEPLEVSSGLCRTADE